MKYQKTREARFLDRPNRFVAHTELDGRIETVHVKNTGRCRELLMPDRRVILAESDNEKRRTRYDLIAVEKPGLGWVNIDSQAPNQVVKEWLTSPMSPFFSEMTLLRPEYPFGQSRVDFYLECGRRKILLEVKGCTLEQEGVGYFPDAPTERGVKHLRELTAAVGEGYECCAAFVITLPGVREVRSNRVTHPEFGDALESAQAAGVQILFLPCEVQPDSLRIIDCIRSEQRQRR